MIDPHLLAGLPITRLTGRCTDRTTRLCISAAQAGLS
uniref:Uncharacterized protein n=1 Tax=Anguilla anguilla TaxID=7936 RepID=A0A0E9VVP4_ANGAN